MIKTFTKLLEKSCVNSKTLVGLCNVYYKRLVREEVDISEIKKEDRVLCIGGGSVPCTALEIHRQTGARVDIIDIDGSAVLNSRKLIERLGLEGKIRVSKDFGQTVNMREYNVVHIALQVTCKDEVLDNIFKNSGENTRVLMRMPKKSLKCFYCNVHSKFSNNLDLCVEKRGFKNIFSTIEELVLVTKVA